MSEEIENQEELLSDTALEIGLFGYTIDHHIYQLAAETFSEALSKVKNLQPSVNHYLIENAQGILLVTTETFTVDQTNISEQLQ